MRICCGYIMWTTCCGCVLWVTVTYVVENMFTNVDHNIHNMYPTTYPLFSTLYVITCAHFTFWLYCGLYVVDNTYLCCGWHVRECCPQHIRVLHNIWYVVENMCRFSTCSPQHTPTIYKVVHNIHPQYMFLDMLWVYVVENNQHMLWSTYVVECNDFYRCGQT